MLKQTTVGDSRGYPFCEGCLSVLLLHLNPFAVYLPEILLSQNIFFLKTLRGACLDCHLTIISYAPIVSTNLEADDP